MDQMQFFAYMYQMNTIALMNRSYPSLCLPSIFGDQNQQKFLEGDEKKYSRTWNKQQIHDAYMKTIKYSEDHHMPISALTLSDFEQISKGLIQSPQQVMLKVNEINKTGTLRPGIWSALEDEILLEMTKKASTWGKTSKAINQQVHNGLAIRSGKQCKERWNNYLNPEINRGFWTNEEDSRILELYNEYGKKWSTIAKMMKDRTESAVKNRIKSLLNKIKQDLKKNDDLEIDQKIAQV